MVFARITAFRERAAALPKELTKKKLRKKYERTKFKWHMYWKYDSRPDMEYYSAVAAVFGVFVWSQLWAPFENWLNMLTTEDPNELAKDPYFQRIVGDRQERDEEYKRRAMESDDRLGLATSRYTAVSPAAKRELAVKDGAAAAQ